MSEETKKSRKESGIYILQFFLLMIAATAAGALINRSAGIIAMTPIAFIICGGAALLKIETKIKLIAIGAGVFFLNTIDQQDLNVTFVRTALCVAICFAVCKGAERLKKSKKQGIIIIASGAVICIVASLFLVGNPISALKAKNTLNEYIEENYPQNESGILGNVEFSGVYFSFYDGTYSMDATSSVYPSETHAISTENGYIFDSFETVMTEKITTPYVLELTSVLRSCFPNDNFSVKCTEVFTPSDTSIFTAEDGSLYGNLSYEITLGGIQTSENMLDGVKDYMSAIEIAGLDYCDITFRGGTGFWTKCRVTVESQTPANEKNYKIDHVFPLVSDRFIDFYKSFAHEKLDIN